MKITNLKNGGILLMSSCFIQKWWGFHICKIDRYKIITLLLYKGLFRSWTVMQYIRGMSGLLELVGLLELRKVENKKQKSQINFTSYISFLIKNQFSRETSNSDVVPQPTEQLSPYLELGCMSITKNKKNLIDPADSGSPKKASKYFPNLRQVLRPRP